MYLLLFFFFSGKALLGCFQEQRFQEFSVEDTLMFEDKTPGRAAFMQTKALRRDLRCKSKQQELLKCPGAEQTSALGDFSCPSGLGGGLDGTKGRPKRRRRNRHTVSQEGREIREKGIASSRWSPSVILREEMKKLWPFIILLLLKISKTTVCPEFW